MSCLSWLNTETQHIVFAWLFCKRLICLPRTFGLVRFNTKLCFLVSVVAKIYVTFLSFPAVAFCLAKWNFSPPHTQFRDHPRNLLWFTHMFGILITRALFFLRFFSPLFSVFALVGKWHQKRSYIKIELTQYKGQMSFSFYFICHPLVQSNSLFFIFLRVYNCCKCKN